MSKHKVFLRNDAGKMEEIEWESIILMACGQIMVEYFDPTLEICQRAYAVRFRDIADLDNIDPKIKCVVCEQIDEMMTEGDIIYSQCPETKKECIGYVSYNKDLMQWDIILSGGRCGLHGVLTTMRNLHAGHMLTHIIKNGEVKER